MHTLFLANPALLHATVTIPPTSFSPVRNADKRRASFPYAPCPRELSKTPWTFCHVPVSCQKRKASGRHGSRAETLRQVPNLLHGSLSAASFARQCHFHGHSSVIQYHTAISHYMHLSRTPDAPLPLWDASFVRTIPLHSHLI